MLRLACLQMVLLVLSFLWHDRVDGQQPGKQPPVVKLPSFLKSAVEGALEKGLKPYAAAHWEVEVGIALRAGARCPAHVKRRLEEKGGGSVTSWMKSELQDKDRSVAIVSIDYTIAAPGTGDSEDPAATVIVYARRPKDWHDLKEITDLLSMPPITQETFEVDNDPIVVKHRINVDNTIRHNQLRINLVATDKEKHHALTSSRFEWDGKAWITK